MLGLGDALFIAMIFLVGYLCGLHTKINNKSNK